MEKTTHYQLNQWAPDDRIMRTDFNGDNAVIDEALHENAQGLAEAKSTLEAALETERQARAAEDGALQQAVAAEQTAREQAVTAEANARSAADTEEANIRSQQDAAIRGELASAVAGAKSEASNAVNAEANTRAGQDAAIRQEFAAADAQLRSENMVVKLGDFTLGANAQQMDVSVQGLNLPGYAAIWIVPLLSGNPNVNTAVYLRCNGITDSVYRYTTNSGTMDYLARFSITNRLYGGLIWVSCAEGIFLVDNFLERSSYNTPASMYLPKATLAPSNIHTLNFTADGPGLYAGSRVVIYGLKL